MRESFRLPSVLVPRFLVVKGATIEASLLISCAKVSIVVRFSFPSIRENAGRVGDPFEAIGISSCTSYVGVRFFGQLTKRLFYFFLCRVLRNTQSPVGASVVDHFLLLSCRRVVSRFVSRFETALCSSCAPSRRQ